MKEFSVAMALTDFVPVVLFTWDKASMNWIAEGVNILAQGSLLLGVFQLHKAGLASLQLEKGDHE